MVVLAERGGDIFVLETALKAGAFDRLRFYDGDVEYVIDCAGITVSEADPALIVGARPE